MMSDDGHLSPIDDHLLPSDDQLLSGYILFCKFKSDGKFPLPEMVIHLSIHCY